MNETELVAEVARTVKALRHERAALLERLRVIDTTLRQLGHRALNSVLTPPRPGSLGDLILRNMSDREMFRTQDVVQMLAACEHKATRGTINWTIKQMTNRGHLTRIGWGVYRVATSTPKADQ